MAFPAFICSASILSRADFGIGNTSIPKVTLGRMANCHSAFITCGGSLDCAALACASATFHCMEDISRLVCAIRTFLALNQTPGYLNSATSCITASWPGSPKLCCVSVPGPILSILDFLLLMFSPMVVSV